MSGMVSLECRATRRTKSEVDMAIAYDVDVPMIEVLKNVRENQPLKNLLVSDPPAHAYLLGYLDPMYDPFMHWYAVIEDDVVKHLAVLYTGLSLPMVFFAGDLPSDSVWKELAEHLPNRFQFHAPVHLQPKIVDIFAPSSHQEMFRMALPKSDYLTLPRRYAQCDRLGHRDTASIMELYRHYPDNLFEPAQLKRVSILARVTMTSSQVLLGFMSLVVNSMSPLSVTL